jgi:transposase InsO family protein
MIKGMELLPPHAHPDGQPAPGPAYSFHLLFPRVGTIAETGRLSYPHDQHRYRPSITMRVLFVLIVLEHDRRKVLHFNVTEHPTGAWTAQQIVEGFADREAAHYLIRDRDSRYSAEVRLRIRSLGMQEIPTAPQSPWQNPYAERLIGSIRRECLNHYIILNARHLKRKIVFLFPLLPRIENPLELWQAMSVPSSGVEGWKDCRNSNNSAVFITDMNVLQHSKFCPDRLLANDRHSRLRAFHHGHHECALGRVVHAAPGVPRNCTGDGKRATKSRVARRASMPAL